MPTRKDIVRHALAHQRPGETPYYMKCLPSVEARLRKHFGVEDLSGITGGHVASFTLSPGNGFARKSMPGNFYYDEFGCLWQGTDEDVGQVKGHPLKDASLGGYTFPNPGDPARLVGLSTFIERNRDKYITANLENHTLLERAFNLRGMAALMMDMHDHPAFVGELLDAIIEYDLRLARQMLKYEIDAIKFNDDWGDQRGILIGAERWRALIKPRMARLCEYIRREKNVDIFLHSDGNISEIMPDIVQLGITAVNPMQPEVMDIFDLKRQYGRDITFFGGMNTQHTMPFGSPEQVVAEARRLVRELGHDGGFILSPGLIVQNDVPTENIAAFIQLCSQQAFCGKAGSALDN